MANLLIYGRKQENLMLIGKVSHKFFSAVLVEFYVQTPCLLTDFILSNKALCVIPDLSSAYLYGTCACRLIYYLE